jgi:hypothetical protein
MVDLLRKHSLQGFLHLRHVQEHCLKFFLIAVAYLLHDTKNFLLLELLLLYGPLQCLHRTFRRWSIVFLRWTGLILEAFGCLFEVAHGRNRVMIPHCAWPFSLRPTA